MPKIIKDETRNYREAILTIDKNELIQILKDIAVKELKLYGKYTVNVEISEATEGSPEYKVGYKAKIIVIEKLGK